MTTALNKAEHIAVRFKVVLFIIRHPYVFFDQYFMKHKFIIMSVLDTHQVELQSKRMVKKYLTTQQKLIIVFYRFYVLEYIAYFS
jgi:hypothetical protein